MLNKSYITFIISLVITQNLSLVNHNPKPSNSLKELLTYVTNYSKQKQVILITDDEQKYKNLVIDTIIREFKRQTLTISLTFEKTTEWRNDNLIQHQSLTNPRSTSIFIVFFDTEKCTYESILASPIEFLTQLSEVNIRPKLLIVHLPKRGNFSYRKLFRNLWSKQFLDATVLQIVSKKVQEHALKSKILDDNEETVFVYHFNPFTGIYDKKLFSFGWQLFPEKLLNLKGHPMQIGLNDDAPFSYFLKKNLSRYQNEIIGPNTNIIKALSEKLNFKIQIILSDEGFGSLGCKKTDFSGLLRKVVYNEIRFLGNFAYYFQYCNGHLQYATSRFLDTDAYVVVVPVITVAKPFTALLPQKAFQTLVLTIIVINSTCVLLHFLGFDNQVWNPLTIFQSILGFTIVSEPRKLAERIFFGSILITQIIFAGYLHTLITDVNLSDESELEFENIRDLEKSGLIPVMHPILRQVLSNSSSGYEQYFLNKSIMMSSNLSSIYYMNMLVKHRNLTCVIRQSLAEIFVKKAAKSQTLLPIKILREPLRVTWRMFDFEPGSPYIERFDQVLLGFIENGLFNKWNENITLELKGPWQKKDPASLKLRFKLFFIPAIGYVLACVVFIAEVLFSMFKRMH